MSVTINASTTTGLVQSADTSGTVEIQSNGTTKLTVSSSGVNIGQMNGGAITAGTAVASTSGTSIDFTSIPSWVKRITVMFSGVSTNGSSNPQIQLGTGSTPTYTTSGYQNISQVGANAPANFTSGFVFGGGAAANTLTGQFVLNNVTGNTWVGSGQVFQSTTTPVYTQGGIALAAALTAVRITTVNGTDTFDAGTINILYEQEFIMSSIRITGDTSGATTLAAPAIAGTATITFPAVSGNALASTAVSASTTNTVTNKIAVNIGGTTYYLLASTSGT